MLGMNTSGLSLLVNGMTADGDGAGPLKTPHHVRVRRILEATTMTDALRAIFDEDRMCSTNYVLAHADGDAINVEAARDRAAYIYPKDGVLTHANHFEKLANVTSTFEKAHPSTLFRAERLKRLMQTANAGIDSKLMRELLGDCFGAPDSICWLPDERAPLEDRLMTIASIVMDLSAGVLWASEGPSVVNTHVPFAVAA
jgi:isopenicillin-N N-acyltransferase-like protein